MRKSEGPVMRTSVERRPPGGDGWSGGPNLGMTLAEVAGDLLGLHPTILGAMDRRGSDPSRGFNVMVRRAMEFALALRDETAAAVPLVSERTARAHRWPDARTANVAMVIAWALVDEIRVGAGIAARAAHVGRRPCGGNASSSGPHGRRGGRACDGVGSVRDPRDADRGPDGSGLGASRRATLEPARATRGHAGRKHQRCHPRGARVRASGAGRHARPTRRQ